MPVHTYTHIWVNTQNVTQNPRHLLQCVCTCTHMYTYTYVDKCLRTQRLNLDVHVPAVCCNVLQCVAVCCSVLQCVAVCYNVLHCVAASVSGRTCSATCSNVGTAICTFGALWMFLLLSRLCLGCLCRIEGRLRVEEWGVRYGGLKLKFRVWGVEFEVYNIELACWIFSHMYIHICIYK